MKQDGKNVQNVLERFDDLMLKTNSYDCDFDLVALGYKTNKAYMGRMLLGTHCYYGRIDDNGLFKNFFGDTLVEVMEAILQYWERID